MDNSTTQADEVKVTQADFDLAEWFLRRMPGWQKSKDQVARLLAGHRQSSQPLEPRRGNTICQECATRHPSYFPCRGHAHPQPQAGGEEHGGDHDS